MLKKDPISLWVKAHGVTAGACVETSAGAMSTPEFKEEKMEEGAATGQSVVEMSGANFNLRVSWELPSKPEATKSQDPTKYWSSVTPWDEQICQAKRDTHLPSASKGDREADDRITVQII